MSAAARAELRSRVEAATLAELDRVGPSAFKRMSVVQQFRDEKVAQSTLFEWIKAVLTNGTASNHMVDQARRVASARVARPPAMTAEEAAREAVAVLPPRLRADDVVGAGGTVAVIDKIQTCIAIAEQVIEQSKNSDGSLRAVKMALAGAEGLRRALETALKLHQAMQDVVQIDRFHDLIIEEISKESPDCAERITVRLAALSRPGG